MGGWWAGQGCSFELPMPGTGGGWLWPRIAPVLLTPCLEHWIISVCSAFCSSLILLSLLHPARRRPSLPGEKSNPRVSWYHSATLTVTGAVATLLFASAIWKSIPTRSSSSSSIDVQDLVFSLSQAVEWLLFSLAVAHERRRSAEKHAVLLRLSWILNFCLAIFLLLSTLLRRSLSPRPESLLNCALVAVTCPSSLFLLVAACVGTTGVSSMTASGVLENGHSQGHENGQLREPLLGDAENGHLREPSSGEDNPEISGYGSAGIVSKLGFCWLNPVLQKGSRQILGLGDIPRMGSAESVESAYAAFKTGWDRSRESESRSKFLPYILVRAHWRDFATTGFLGILKLCVMYVGPLLIQRFIDFTEREGTRWQDGVGLVALLLVAKGTEVVCDHQSNFVTAKIGVKMWAGLVAAVYQKGLRITGAARQGHGTGKIVNYMSVDAKDVSDACVNIQNLWLLPIQIALALAILRSVVGVASFAGVGTMVFVMLVCLLIAAKQQSYQRNIKADRDRRMKITSEVLGNMKIIKLCAWTDRFLARVESARAAERRWISRLLYLNAGSIFFLWLSPLAVAVFTFGTCVLIGTELTPGKVFTAIATFRILQQPLRNFPQLVMKFVQALVAIHRLNTYLESPELDETAVSRRSNLPSENNGKDPFSVVVEDGSFRWDPDSDAPTLTHIDIRVEIGSLAAIVGPVGTGKSALLSCLLGEMHKTGGSVSVRGTVAYVAQTPWIQNGTIKDNVLFGKGFDEALYAETLRVCALDGDLAQMVHGDRTEIGERGVNLSGGQKQRVQLARAVYQDADVYLLDDVFSALDAHTSSDIFRDCVRGTLRPKTVLLVTHQVEFLRAAQLIVVMRDGAVAQSGRYADLVGAGTDLATLVDAHKESLEAREKENDDDDDGGAKFSDQEEEDEGILASSISSLGGFGLSPSREGNGLPLSRQGSGLPLSREGSTNYAKFGSSSSSKRKNLPRTTSGAPRGAVPKASGQLIEEEEREKGQVGWAVYWAYATGILYGTHVVALLVIQTVWQVLQIGSDVWLAQSTSADAAAGFRPRRFISVYAALALASGIFVLARSALVSFAGLRTAQRLFLDMVRSVFRAPMSFFDTTPAGRVLTRSSTNQASVDDWIPFVIGSTLAIGFQAVGVLVVMCAVNWQTLFVVAPLSVVFVRVQRFYIASSREFTRLQSVTQAPIIQHFSETISGFTTVRAFGHQARFVASNVRLVNTNMALKFHTFGSAEWLGFRLEALGTLILCSSALILVLLPKGLVRPQFVGLSLSYGLALNVCLFWLVVCVCETEKEMVNVERILQYTRIASEAPAVVEGKRPDPSWPGKGAIAMKNVRMRYRPDTPLVLKGVSFAIRGGEKLGVVGRTGSGKSSLIQVLFRIVEPAGGAIVLDGVDIATIGLRDLRSKLGIIPQEPTLFEGDVRNNVDPLGEHSDAEIWAALGKCQLADAVRGKEGGLDSAVAEGGENWSMGQRQLFCLGRALLRRSRVLVLDEATASVDTRTDVVLGRTIAREFPASTVISIAHRIPTVMDSDKVLVLDAGTVREFASPAALLDEHQQAGSSSLFAALVREYWNRAAQDDSAAGAD